MIRAYRTRGFTLVELLIVIGIILIAASVLFTGLGGGGDGLKLSSAQRIAASIAQGARGQAILKDTKTRLIIYSENNDSGDVEKKLRFFGIIHEDPENEDQWFAGTQGTYLPDGIYFDPQLSGANAWPQSRMNIEFPRRSAQSDGSGPEYYYYEFNPNGTMATSFQNSWLVVRAGTLRPNTSGDLEVDFTNESKENIRAALIFRRVGTTTLVTDPEEIN